MTKKTPLEDFKKSQREFLTCKPSRLIRMAVEDLKKCEKSKRYKIDMSEWIEKKEDCYGRKLCYVCLAGACVSRRFDITKSVSPFKDGGLKHTIIDGHSKAVAKRMCALDFFRVGYVAEGLKELGIRKPKKKIEMLTQRYSIYGVCAIPAYHSYADNNAQFKARLLELADDLEAVNL